MTAFGAFVPHEDTLSGQFEVGDAKLASDLVVRHEESRVWTGCRRRPSPIRLEVGRELQSAEPSGDGLRGARHQEETSEGLRTAPAAPTQILSGSFPEPTDSKGCREVRAGRLNKTITCDKIHFQGQFEASRGRKTAPKRRTFTAALREETAPPASSTFFNHISADLLFGRS